MMEWPSPLKLYWYTVRRATARAWSAANFLVVALGACSPAQWRPWKILKLCFTHRIFEWLRLKRYCLIDHGSELWPNELQVIEVSFVHALKCSNSGICFFVRGCWKDSFISYDRICTRRNWTEALCVHFRILPGAMKLTSDGQMDLCSAFHLCRLKFTDVSGAAHEVPQPQG